jgi:hypothetical protein
MSRGYRLAPWRSPYLRWRIETYTGTHADRIGFREFWRMVWRTRREMARYLRWAAKMDRVRREGLGAAVRTRPAIMSSHGIK